MLRESIQHSYSITLGAYADFVGGIGGKQRLYRVPWVFIDSLDGSTFGLGIMWCFGRVFQQPISSYRLLEIMCMTVIVSVLIILF